jgi:NAD+ kinase
MQVAIVAQRGNDRTAELAGALRDRLRKVGVSVWLDDATAGRLDVKGRPVGEFHAADLVVSIGGDGTFLFAAHGAGDTPILGVNLGEVGFLNPVNPDDAVDAVLSQVRQFRTEGSFPTRSRPRLATRGDGWTLPSAINEVVIQGTRRGHGGGADLTVRIDGSEYSSGHADGVLVATPTGSTAYNLSENGPLIHPAVSGFVVTGMSATRGMPPLVVDSESTVTVSVDDPAEAVVIADGRIRERVDTPTEVRVGIGDDPIRTVGPSSDFFEALEKLD